MKPIKYKTEPWFKISNSREDKNPIPNKNKNKKTIKQG